MNADRCPVKQMLSPQSSPVARNGQQGHPCTLPMCQRLIALRCFYLARWQLCPLHCCNYNSKTGYKLAAWTTLSCCRMLDMHTCRLMGVRKARPAGFMHQIDVQHSTMCSQHTAAHTRLIDTALVAIPSGHCSSVCCRLYVQVLLLQGWSG